MATPIRIYANRAKEFFIKTSKEVRVPEGFGLFAITMSATDALAVCTSLTLSEAEMTIKSPGAAKLAKDKMKNLEDVGKLFMQELVYRALNAGVK